MTRTQKGTEITDHFNSENKYLEYGLLVYTGALRSITMFPSELRSTQLNVLSFNDARQLFFRGRSSDTLNICHLPRIKKAASSK